MRSASDDRVEPTVAILAPVPRDVLNDAHRWKPGGEVAFGTRAGMVFAELEAMRASHRVRVFIYASHDETAPRPRRVTWSGEYVGLEEGVGGRHPDEATYRSPLAREDGLDYWLVFWHVIGLRQLSEHEQTLISTIRGHGRRTPYSRSFEPEGPLLIEPI